MATPSLSRKTPSEGLPTRVRIATGCVCCGSRALKKSPAILMPFVAHRALGWEPVEITEDWGLRTIKNGMAYSICNSLQCVSCGLLFLDVRFTKSQMHSLYDGYRDEQYTQLREKYEPGYRERNDALDAGVDYVAEIEAFLTPHLRFPISLLDWGGDTGKNTPFKNSNQRFHIYDISSKPVIAGAEQVGKSTAVSTQYDLVVCSNVLEHIPYPAQTLLDIQKCMGRETVLYIEVPHEDIVRTASTETELCTKKKHWHEHVNFFTETSLQRLLSRCGLSAIDGRRLEVTVAGKSVGLFLIACRLTSPSGARPLRKSKPR